MHRPIWLAAAIVLLLAPPASAVVRHASPTGVNTVSNCTSSEPPCSLRRAVETVAVSGDEVVLESGVYNLTSPVVVSDAISLHGAAGGPRPRVVSTTQTVFSVTNGNAVVADLQLEAPGSVIAAGGNAILERLIVLAGPAINGRAVQLSDGGTLRDSFVHTVATNAEAVRAVRQTPRLVNVTAIATDPGGIGLVTDAVTSGICVPPFSADVIVTNSILRGGLYDISVPLICDGPQLAIVAASNFRAAKVNQVPPDARLVDAGGNQDVEPLFAAPAALDFHQLAGSGTIDAGVGGPLLGSADVDGEPRTMGGRPDIGADEYAPPAPPPPPPPTPDLQAPVASLLALTPASFRAPEPARRAQRRRSGTRISYALDEAARVTLTVQRAVRRRGRTRYVRVPGSLVHAGAVGGNRLRFSGRLGRRSLQPGRYRLVAVPTDAAGNVGRAVRASFRVMR